MRPIRSLAVSISLEIFSKKERTADICLFLCGANALRSWLSAQSNLERIQLVFQPSRSPTQGETERPKADVPQTCNTRYGEGQRGAPSRFVPPDGRRRRAQRSSRRFPAFDLGVDMRCGRPTAAGACIGTRSANYRLISKERSAV